MPIIHIKVFWTYATYQKSVTLATAINYKAIQLEVVAFLNELQITTKRYYIYENISHEEKELQTNKQFTQDVDVSCRFHNDSFLMKKRMKQLEQKMETCVKQMSTESDPLSLNRLPSLTTKKISSIISITSPKKSIDIAILISNPLVRRTQEQIVSTLKPLTSLNPQKQRLKDALKKINPELHSKIAIANEDNVRDCGSRQAKILVLICDVQWDADKQEASLLLQDLGRDKEYTTGMQKAYTIPSFVTLLGNTPKLIILIGWQAHMARQELQSHSINVITINTRIYGRDTMAQTFLSKYYEFICQGESIKNSYLNAIDYFGQSVKQQDQRINEADLCCCLHQHQQGCKFQQLSAQYGEYLAHQEFHRFCTEDCQFNCKISPIFEQIKSSQDGDTRCRTFCCCSAKTDVATNHAIDKKFRMFFKNDSDLALFHPLYPLQKLQPCVQVPKTTCKVTQTELSYTQLPHRNKDIWFLLQFLHRQEQRINIYSGPTHIINEHDDEKSMLVKNAICYLLQRNEPIEYVQLHLKSDMNGNDLKRQIGSKLHHQYRSIPTNEDLIQRMENRRLVISIMVPHEEQRQKVATLAHLMDQINQFSNQLKGKIKKTLVILTEEKLPPEMRQGDEQWLLRSLEVNEALDIFLTTINNKRNQGRLLFDLNKQKLQNMRRALEDLKNTSRPLTERIVRQATSGKIIKNFSDTVKLLKPMQVEEPNTVLIQPNKELREMLQFLSQFSEGVSFPSMLQMARLEILPQNWDKILKKRVEEEERMTEDLKKDEEGKQKTQDLKKQSKSQQRKDFDFGMPVQYFSGLKPGRFQLFDIVVIEKQLSMIKVHKRRLGAVEQEEARKHELNKLRYLSIESMNFMAALRMKWQYKSELFDYNAMSRIGFFYYKTEGEKLVEKEIDKNFETVEVEKNIMKQKQYFNQIFKTKIQLLQQEPKDPLAPSPLDYYCTAILNFTTLMRLMIGRVAWQLIDGSIEQAIRSVSELKKQDISRNLLLIKLQVMKMGIKIFRKEHETLEGALSNFSDKVREYIENISDRTLKSSLEEVRKIEFSTMRLFTMLGAREQTVSKQFLESAKMIFQKLEKQLQKFKIQKSNLSGVKTRIVIFIAQSLRKAENQQIQACRPLLKLKQDLIQATQYLSDPKESEKYHYPVLAAHNRLLRIHIMMRLCHGTEESLLKIKGQIDSIAQVIKNPVTIMSNQRRTDEQQKPEDTFKSTELTKYFEFLLIENNKKIIKKFKEVLVFMRAQPVWTNSNSFNVRKPNSFRRRIQNTLSSSKVITRFKRLTRQALLGVLEKGCIIMVLTLDIDVQQIKEGEETQDTQLSQGTHDKLRSPSQGSEVAKQRKLTEDTLDYGKKKLSLLLQDEKLPTVERVDYSSISKQLINANFQVLILCGRNTRHLLKKLRQGRKNSQSMIYALDTSEELGYKNMGQQYFCRQCKSQFIEDILIKYFEDIAKGRNNIGTSEINHSLYYYFDITQKTKFKEISQNWTPSYASLEKKQKVISFAKGQCTDASSELFSPHNFIASNYGQTVARQKEIYELAKIILELSQKYKGSKGSKGKYLNVIGPVGIGKRTTITEVAWQLILKRHFVDGIYQINCGQLTTPIMDHIQNQTPTLYKTLTDLQKMNPSLLIILFNVDRLEDFYNDQFFREAEQKNITVVFTSILKIQQPICLNYELKPFSDKQIEMFVYSSVDIQKVVKENITSQTILKEFYKVWKKEDRTPGRLVYLIMELSGYLSYFRNDRMEMEFRQSLAIDRSNMGRSEYMMSGVEYPDLTASSRHAILSSQIGVIETSSTKAKQYIKLKLN